MANKSYQVPKDTSSYWKNNTSLPSFASLKDNIKTDILIVGAGITGITTAYLLRNQGFNVTLIESDTILSGTTEYTTGKITAQHGLIYDELIQHFGVEKAKQYYQAANDAKQWIHDTIIKEQLDCDFTTQDAYLYTNDEKEIKNLDKEYEAYQQLKIDGELVTEMPLGIPIRKALVMKNQAQFHPLAFLKHLVTSIHEDDINIYEHTTAVDIDYQESITVTTKDNHKIACKQLVMASHYPFHDKSGMYFSRMYEERSYLIAVKTNTKFPGGMYVNVEQPSRTVRATADNGEEIWLVGGERHKTGQEKEAINHHEQLELFADQNFGITSYHHRWSAQDLTTVDKLPYIGPVTKNKPRAMIATGYRKWGMTSGTQAAIIISDLLLEKENPYATLFTPSRFDFDPDVKNFFQMNTNVAKHMIKGKLGNWKENHDKLEKNQATILREQGKRVGVYRDDQGNLGKLDTTCPHMKCEVNWNSTEKSWDCPCHGSRFSIDGKVLEGPAKTNLTKIVD
ncbi:glycine/D-amino acid oxidase-like deaminating enzyme/nitrite reductase/ring-hydroxylating ferredoxin subunit [Natronobacillus azotifigens]|uniref:FAD-dependent oxidoreductase n=1 Tax=Natronobacillus azotifigens TaxID=472978 RepID=A0A9J6R9H1_9BACI|nr:FAD-dependent oxidoreductase [Natronobacillus azotifigens]MCZ0701924.1 FAD-dependent oxidoreductase [Natronobacillus azotifigens]